MNRNLLLLAVSAAWLPSVADAQSSKYYARIRLGPMTAQPVAEGPKVVAVTCSPVIPATGPLSGSKTELGNFATVLLAMAACEAASKAGYVPNLCQTTRYSSTGLYRTQVMADGVMNPAGSSPDYTIGGVTYSYASARCSPK
jgi:hypothetical protein